MKQQPKTLVDTDSLSWPGRIMVVAIACLMFIPAGYAKTLEEAVQTALATNPQVLGAEASRRAARQDVRQARGGYLPSVNLTGSVGREYSDIKQLHIAGKDNRALTPRKTGLSLSQMVYDGFATRNEVERRQALLDASHGRVGGTWEQVALGAVSSYLEVLKGEQLVKLAESNLAAHKKIWGKVKLGVDRGVRRRADLQQASSRLALARSVLVARRGRLREVTTNYRRVVGEAPKGLLSPGFQSAAFIRDGQLDNGALNSAIDAGVSRALAENPSLKAAIAEKEAAAAAVRGTKAAFMPRVDLELGANRDSNLAGVEGVRNTNSVMLVGRWNLFRGGSDKAREQAQVHRHFAAVDLVADTRRAIEEDVTVSLHAKATSEERLIHLGAYVEASAETLRAYRSQHELGRRSLLDLLDAENELFAARSNLSSGRFDDLFNHHFVAASQGRLVSSLGIEGPSR